MAKKSSIASQAAAIVKAVKVAEAKPMNPAPRREPDEYERKYRAEEALRTLTRAEECKRDKALMGDVKRLANEQMKSLQSLSGGRRRGEK